jgi:DNA-binding LacI/PurR family transcriptional regulator
MRRRGVPIVAVDVKNWPDTSFVAVDDEAGARAAAEHIASLGHREVAVVAVRGHASDDAASMPHRRLAGFRAGLGLPPTPLARGELPAHVDGLRIITAPNVSEEGGRQAFAELWREPRPTAVLAMADVLAIGLLRAAREARVAVPQQLSIVGFDDIPPAAWTNPALTTVHQPIHDLGRAGARLLIEILRSSAAPPPGPELLPTHLVVRESSGPPSGDLPGDAGILAAIDNCSGSSRIPLIGLH